MDSNRMVAGIACSAGARGLTLAVLTPRLEVHSLKPWTIDDAARELLTFEEISAAIAGPLRPNPASGGVARRGKTGGARSGETEIRGRRIPIRPAPSAEAGASAAMRATFGLARELSKRGFLEGASERKSPRFLIETRALACAAVLLGRIPFGRATLEGKSSASCSCIARRSRCPTRWIRLRK